MAAFLATHGASSTATSRRSSRSQPWLQRIPEDGNTADRSSRTMKKKCDLELPSKVIGSAALSRRTRSRLRSPSHSRTLQSVTNSWK
jgi:hypothetical protein